MVMNGRGYVEGRNEFSIEARKRYLVDKLSSG
jgi:hypothetical protein